MTELTQAQEDLLKELANVGMGNTATSLAKMVDSFVNISLPSMSIIHPSDFCDNDPQKYCITTSGIEGELKGMLTIVFSEEQSFWLVDKMFANPEGTTTEINEDGIAAMKEFCNIIGGAFLSALSDLTQIDFMPKIPSILIGTNQTICEDYKKLVSDEVKDILSVETRLAIDGKTLEGNVYMILDETSFKKLFETIGY